MGVVMANGERRLVHKNRWASIRPPVVVNADSIIYLPEFTKGEIDSYAAVFDKKSKGKNFNGGCMDHSAIFAADLS